MKEPVRIATFVILLFLTATNCQADFKTLSVEKTKLLERIQCNWQAYTPPSDGLGSLWGCYDSSENVKLWINGGADDPKKIKNIKLAIVTYDWEKLDFTGKIWAKIILETYAGNKAKQIHADCLAEKSGRYQSGDYSFELRYHKGPKASERILIVTDN